MFTLRSLFSKTARRTETAAWRLSFPLILGPIDTKAVLALVDGGVSDTWTDKNGETLLMAAVQAMQPDAVRRMIELGADVNIAVAEGMPNAGRTALHVAAEHGNKFSLEAIVKGGGRVNAVDGKGNTPLHYAAGDEDKLKLLLTPDANINARDAEGLTPLMRAAKNSLSAAPVALLLSKGADVTVAAHDGRTLLTLAQANPWLENLQIVRLVEAALDAQAVIDAAKLKKDVAVTAATIATVQRDISVFRRPVTFRPA